MPISVRSPVPAFRGLLFCCCLLVIAGPTVALQEAVPTAAEGASEGAAQEIKPPQPTSSEQELAVAEGEQGDDSASEISEASDAEAKSTDPDSGKLPLPEDLSGPPADAEVSETGLASRVLTAGTGKARPNMASRVRVHYAGWTPEGEQIENTYNRDEPPFLAVAEVIDGWREGLQLMVEGEKRRLWVPGEMAFEGRATMPQGTIIFDIELVEIIDPPKAPEHLTSPAPGAEIHGKKGLASLRLVEGHDVLQPRAESFVTVHYTGWSTDGSIVDSSVLRGEPSTFKLTHVIKGWREGLQYMVAGEKRRFWIPEKLAYKGDKTKPQGMLIFDIELIAIPRY